MRHQYNKGGRSVYQGGSYFFAGGQGGIRTPEGVSQQVYSLPRLTTSVPARAAKTLYVAADTL